MANVDPFESPSYRRIKGIVYPIIYQWDPKIMNQAKFEVFSQAYKDGLREAVEANPADYFMQGSTPEVYAEVVSKKMMGNIAAGKHMGNNYDGGGFRRACKKVGIKHTRKAILEFLEIK